VALHNACAVDSAETNSAVSSNDVAESAMTKSNVPESALASFFLSGR
jgi:hypothetical protein